VDEHLEKEKGKKIPRPSKRKVHNCLKRRREASSKGTTIYNRSNERRKLWFTWRIATAIRDAAIQATLLPIKKVGVARLSGDTYITENRLLQERPA